MATRIKQTGQASVEMLLALMLFIPMLIVIPHLSRVLESKHHNIEVTKSELFGKTIGIDIDDSLVSISKTPLNYSHGVNRLSDGMLWPESIQLKLDAELLIATRERVVDGLPNGTSGDLTLRNRLALISNSGAPVSDEVYGETVRNLVLNDTLKRLVSPGCVLAPMPETKGCRNTDFDSESHVIIDPYLDARPMREMSL